MDKGFKAIFNLNVPRHEVWENCRFDVQGEICRIPGFPSSDTDLPGCRARVLEYEPERCWLRCRKDDWPCIGTEITIRVEPANASGWPTRVHIEQGGFDPSLFPLKEIFETHWLQIVANFRLYLERRVHAPDTRWGPSLGATVQQTPIGLEIVNIDEDGFAARCGLSQDDVLIAIDSIRIHDLAQLWTVLALKQPDSETTVSWVHGRKSLDATESL